ncbi:MAG: hypothetical protein ACI4VQ_06230 [Clostridia bacterium]
MFSDVEYISNRIDEIYRGIFEDITFKTEIHEKTYTLHIHIIGYAKTWDFFYELDKNIPSLASIINKIVEDINNRPR